MIFSLPAGAPAPFAHNGDSQKRRGWTVVGAITAMGGTRGQGRIETCPLPIRLFCQLCKDTNTE